MADINIRDYIALQPGFFFQSRSGNHTYVNSLPSTDVTSRPARVSSVKSEMVQYGHDRSYAFNIPILCSVRFNISDDVRWSLDLGPYLAFTLKNDVDRTGYFTPGDNFSQMKEVKPRSFDVGAKMGTGLNIKDHYYVGIHYWAGGLHRGKMRLWAVKTRPGPSQSDMTFKVMVHPRLI